MAQTSKARTLVPVRPAEPLAGAPDRSPIPLADNVQAGAAAVTAAAGSAKVAAGGAVEQVVGRVQDLLPRRKPAYRRVTPLSSRRETQRRAAVAALALVTVVGGLGLAVYTFGGTGGTRQAISSVNAGQAAIDRAEENLAEVSGPGIDLTETDPEQALELLTEAYTELDAAETAKVSARVVDPLRADVVELLDRLYGVVPVASAPLFAFTPDEGAQPFDLGGLVQGPDGVPYVIDKTTQTVYRVDLKRQRATAVVRAGKKSSGTTVAEPKFLTVGGRDLLILDAKNVLWRWRPSDDAGKGTLTDVNVNGASQWGDDITAIDTFVRDVDRGLYNLYVVDPSEEQIRSYPPANDGSGFPTKASGWLATARAVDEMTSMYIDGNMFVAEGGILERFTRGNSDGWEWKPPEDELLRKPARVTLVSGAGDPAEGTIYGFDAANGRVLAFDKGDGEFIAQYRLANGKKDWSDLREMYVIPGVDDAPDSLVWLGKDSVHQVPLVEVPDGPAPSAGPSGGASAAPSAGASGATGASAAPSPAP